MSLTDAQMPSDSQSCLPTGVKMQAESKKHQEDIYSVLSENGLSKETKIAAPWVKREKFKSLFQTAKVVSPGKARRSNWERFPGLKGGWEKGSLTLTS